MNEFALAAQELLGAAFQSDVSRFGLAFAFAAWIHSGRVKKEIRSQMENVVSAVDNVAAVLKQDLKSQGDRLGQVENGLDRLSTRVSTLEQK